MEFAESEAHILVPSYLLKLLVPHTIIELVPIHVEST